MAENLSSLEVGDPPVHLLGYSVAGEESVVGVPELDVMFDIGKAPRQLLSLNHVCLTHGHMDHAAGLAYYFWQRDFQDNPGGRVLLPRELHAPVERMLRDWAAVEGHLAPFELLPMQSGDRYEVRRDLFIQAFDVPHGRQVPALGYLVYEVRRKLRPELAGLTGPEIVALKNKGAEVTFATEVPLVAYLGDSQVFDLTTVPLLADARVLMAECTFVDADHVSRARAGCHVHVTDLPRLLATTRAQAVVLTHLTRRSGMLTARRALKKTLAPADLARVHLLMDRKHKSEDPQPASGDE
ncbi:MAG: Ribonuclease BN [Phycisphaerae bacterium]|nr:Ribonuclease BN [Phycisphaerae bacterium]